MAPQTIKITLQRDSLQTPWGFRLQGGIDFFTPFTVNKINAGSPADGILHRGDVILEIDGKAIGSMLHAEALELVQRAGGQVTFLLQRGLTPNPQPSHQLHQRPMSAMPWSIANATSYLEMSGSPFWSPSTYPQSPTSYYRSRALERIPDPKPVLSQTGSPLMPGPVPSVSTKTRGYVQPPVFHTQRQNWNNESSSMYSPATNGFTYLDAAYNSRVRPWTTNALSADALLSNASNQASYQPPWKDTLKSDNNIYIPSYQKKVNENPNAKEKMANNRSQNTGPQYMTVTRLTQQRQPVSVQPTNLVHRQYNSPMGLYSQDNIRDVINSHVSHISQISVIPSLPKLPRTVYSADVSASQLHQANALSNEHTSHLKSAQTTYASEF